MAGYKRSFYESNHNRGISNFCHHLSFDDDFSKDVIEQVIKIGAGTIQFSSEKDSYYVDFKKFIAQPVEGAKYIAHCYESEKVLLKDVLEPGENATILIGPEGDFSPEEVELAIKAGYRPVSLGHSRLRTETAGLVACHTYILKNEI